MAWQHGDTIKVIISDKDGENIAAAIIELDDANLNRIRLGRWEVLEGFRMRTITDIEWDTFVDAFGALPIVDINDYMEPLDNPIDFSTT